MTRKQLITAAATVALAVIQRPAAAQGNGTPHLHAGGKWDECSIQLAPTLTQGAWRQFTQEAGLVAYFRPLAGAEPLGRGRYEISAVQWETAIDQADAAWNDTFVHPDSAHYLFEGSGLKFPGLMLRAGISAGTDVGLYVTKNPNANYGFFGGQLQRRLVGAENGRWTASGRVSFVSLYGPEDLGRSPPVAEDVVVREAFTSQMAAAGKALLRELDKGSWRPPAAFWLFVPEAAQWRLLLADPELNQSGPRSAYQHIFDALKKVTPASNELTLHDIAVVDPKTPIVQLLHTAIRTGPGIGGIRFSRNVINGHFVEDAYIYRLA